MALSKEQVLLYGELDALVKAWMDRGALARDVAPLFGTFFVATCLDAQFELSTAVETVIQMWDHFVKRLLDESAKVKKSG